jgi:alpha-glucosidase
MSGWSQGAVVYEIYPRSFQDSDGDGVGDLVGIASRLPYLQWLGIDAIWLAPIYASPLADYGYDVRDHTAIAPEYGTLGDFDALLVEAHERDIRVVLDLVVSHTSIQHPWFRERPDFYVWADGPEPPNNWRASFGGAAWSRDDRDGRLYLHSFYAEQPDLDWRNPAVREAMSAVVRFWAERGVDGFRIDAVDRMVKDAGLRDDPPAQQPFPLPIDPEVGKLDLIHSRDAPDISIAVAALREAAGDLALIGEVYLPVDRVIPYLEHLDAAFAFELLHSRWHAAEVAAVIERSSDAGRVAWVTSNHDFPRVATRWGEENVRAAAVLLMTLGGMAFVYQGEEIGMFDGGETEAPRDRFGRDACRSPMQWDGGPKGGFTTGSPWLPPVDPGSRNVAAQRADRYSVLNLFRRLIALRRRITGRLRLIEAPQGALVFERGRHLIAINFDPERTEIPVSAQSEPVLESSPGSASRSDGRLLLAPHSAAVLCRREVG